MSLAQMMLLMIPVNYQVIIKERDCRYVCVCVCVCGRVCVHVCVDKNIAYKIPIAKLFINDLAVLS